VTSTNIPSRCKLRSAYGAKRAFLARRTACIGPSFPAPCGSSEPGRCRASTCLRSSAQSARRLRTRLPAQSRPTEILRTCGPRARTSVHQKMIVRFSLSISWVSLDGDQEDAGAEALSLESTMAMAARTASSRVMAVESRRTASEAGRRGESARLRSRSSRARSSLRISCG
jgi:hypothetical protein